MGDRVEVKVCGGPLAQADFRGSWVGIFGVDVVEGLLILGRKKGEKRGIRPDRCNSPSLIKVVKGKGKLIGRVEGDPRCLEDLWPV